MVEAWIYARQGLTMPDGRAYGFINLVIKDDDKLVGFKTYEDDYERKKIVTMLTDSQRIVHLVENFNPKMEERWYEPLDLAVKTEIPEEKARNVMTMWKILESVKQRIIELQEKAKKLENSLYDEIEGIYREKAEQFRKEIEE